MSAPVTAARAVRRQIPALLLLLLCLAAFLGVGKNGFVTLDDGLSITGNPMVARGLSAAGIGWAFTTTRTGNWHPLTWLSHMLDVSLFGMDAGRHHLVSLALHAGSALLLYYALGALTGAFWRSFFVAALFAVHPMRVESVAWASERKDVLAMLFTLLALRAYLGALRRPGVGQRLAPFGFFALALLAKPTPVTFPFLLLLLDWWPLGRWSPQPGAETGGRPAIRALLPPWALWREKAPLFLLAVLAGAVTSIAQTTSGSVAAIWYIPLPARAANAVQSFVAYLASTLWPRGLTVFYPHPFTLPPSPLWCMSLLLLVAATVLVWRSRRRFPWLPVGWFWYLGALLPMIGLVQVGMQARADRYSYLPHIGIFMLMVWGFAEGFKQTRARPAVPAAGVVAVLLLVVVTVVQIPFWRSGVTLFTRALDVASRHQPGTKAPGSPALAFIHNGLGQAYFDEGRLDEAIVQFRSAVAYNRFFPAAKYNLARALEEKGDDVEANAFYIQALDPHLPEPWNNLGSMLVRRGQLEEGIRLFEKAVAIDPLYVEPRSNLGAALGLAGRAAAAERELRSAVTLDPEYEPARFNLGKLLLEQGRYGDAVDQLKESIRLQPKQAAAIVLLAQAYSRSGRTQEAEHAYRQALEIDPALGEGPGSPPPGTDINSVPR